MPLLRLANEVLCCISENLELERDINAFTQANRRLYRLLNNYLYRYNIEQSGSSALLWAALHGQEATAQKLVDKGADVNAQGGQYGNALQAASSGGHEQIVQRLLENGADVDAQGGLYGNALQAGSSGGHDQMVQRLLEKGADVNAQGGEYGNALQVASS